RRGRRRPAARPGRRSASTAGRSRTATTPPTDPAGGRRPRGAAGRVPRRPPAGPRTARSAATAPPRPPTRRRAARRARRGRRPAGAPTRARRRPRVVGRVGADPLQGEQGGEQGPDAVGPLRVAVGVLGDGRPLAAAVAGDELLGEPLDRVAVGGRVGHGRASRGGGDAATSLPAPRAAVSTGNRRVSGGTDGRVWVGGGARYIAPG